MMLKNLINFEKNEKNSNNKMFHTLLFKEQFKYLKTTHPYHLVEYGFQIVYVILTSENLIILIVLVSMVGWRFLFSIIKQPSSFKQKLADQYIIFLVSVLSHETIPTRFIIFTLTLGSFLGRKFVWIWSVPFPNSLWLIIFSPFLTFFVSFVLMYGYFILSVAYPSVFGKFLISFLELNASKHALFLIGLKKKPSLSKNKIQVKRSRKWYYSTTTALAVVGPYEAYAEIKKITMTDNLSKSAIEELGKLLDNAVGINTDIAYQILDKCAEDISLCNYYVLELAKSPDNRNLALNTFAHVKGEVKAKFSYSTSGSLLEKSFNTGNPTESIETTVADSNSVSKVSDGFNFQVEGEISASSDTKISLQKGKTALLKSKKVINRVGLPLMGLGVGTHLLANIK